MNKINLNPYQSISNMKIKIHLVVKQDQFQVQRIKLFHILKLQISQRLNKDMELHMLHMVIQHLLNLQKLVIHYNLQGLMLGMILIPIQVLHHQRSVGYYQRLNKKLKVRVVHQVLHRGHQRRQVLKTIVM